ncbi:DNA polymerase III subunit delta [Pseudothermotoga sp. U03pept]|uniref:DNA polymerase III subunit delta n=1 Tax=Pseudothermotoga sp. U03pept TaxID=3447012 RepID=UPI003F06514E
MSTIVLSGDATVLKDEHVKRMALERGLTRIRLDIEDAARSTEIFNQNNLFSQNFLIDVVDFDDWKKDDQKQLIERIENTTMPVILRSLKTIKGFESLDFSLPKPWERERWIEYVEERLRAHSMSFEKCAAEEIFQMVGPDDLLIEREIEKLACIGEKVTLNLVKEIVFNHSKIQMDELCFAISSADKSSAHKILSKILSHVEPVLILNSLIRYFIDLYKIVVFADKRSSYSWVYIKDLSQRLDVPVVRAAKMMGFVFKGQPPTVNHLQLYDVEKVESILNQLQLLDKELKSSENKTIPIYLFVDSVAQLTGGQN